MWGRGKKGGRTEGGLEGKAAMKLNGCKEKKMRAREQKCKNRRGNKKKTWTL